MYGMTAITIGKYNPMEAVMTTDKILVNCKQVQQLAGIGRSSIYKLMNDNQFPRPVKISSYGVRWYRAEVLAWIESRPRATGQLNAA